MFYAYLSIVILVSIGIIAILSIQHLYTKRINDLSLMIHHFSRKLSILEAQDERLIKLLNNQQPVIASLSTSVNDAMKTMVRERNEKILPTPQLSEMILKTIEEQIQTEFVLSSNKAAASADSVEKIIANTQRTYPHVDRTYIAKRCISAAEAAFRVGNE